MNSCRDCRYSKECDHGTWICVHPDLLEAGTTIIVGASPELIDDGGVLQ